MTAADHATEELRQHPNYRESKAKRTSRSTDGLLRKALIPMHLVADRTVVLAALVSFLGNAEMFGIVAYLPTLIQNIFGVGSTASGLLLLPLTLGLVGGGIIAGRIVASTGRYRMILISGAVIATIGMGLLSTINSQTPVWLVELFILVISAGLGLYSHLVIVLAQSTAPSEHTGTVTAFVTFTREIGVTVGIAVLGALFSSRLVEALATHDGNEVAAYESAFLPLLLSLTVLYSAAIIVVCLMPHRELTTTSATSSPPQ